MPVEDRAALQAQAELIRDETVTLANTATRVGGTLLDIIDSMAFEDSSAYRVWQVGQAPWMYASVADAVTAIDADPTPPAATNRALIYVWPGKYTSTAVTVIPEWTSVRGAGRGVVQFQNDTTDLFQVGGQSVFFSDFLIEGSSVTTLYAFDCNNQSRVHIERVDMGNNGGAATQRFLKQSGTTWSVLKIKDCVVDFRGLSNYACDIRNTGAAARFVDGWVMNCFFDAFGLTSFGGSFNLFGVQDFRFWHNVIRGAPTHNTGVRLNLGGVTGVPNCEIAHAVMCGSVRGSGGVACFPETGTVIFLDGSVARGATAAGGGTLTEGLANYKTA